LTEDLMIMMEVQPADQALDRLIVHIRVPGHSICIAVYHASRRGKQHRF
jgi:hypothetical protein